MADRINVWVQRATDRQTLRLQWFDPETGKRRSMSAKTADPEKAERLRADKEYELNHGLHEETSKMKWETFREMYEREAAPGRTEKGIQRVVASFSAMERFGPPKTISHANERYFSRLIVLMREKGLSPSTIKSYFAHIKAALRWAERQRILPKAPHIEMPSIPKNVSKSKVQKAARITTEEFERLLAACPSRTWELLVMLGWHCGLRLTEALQVQGEHFDLTGHRVYLPTNKAKDVASWAVITPELHDYLNRRWPDGIPAGRLVRDVPKTEAAIICNFRRIAKKASVAGNGKFGVLTFHDLRRSFGSRWAGKVPAQVLQRMMRHSHISVTMTYYADAENAAISAVWGGVPVSVPKGEISSPKV